MHRRLCATLAAVTVMSAVAGCETAKQAASQIKSQLPEAHTTATIPPQPKDLSAATAAAQEKTDRHTSGDFAGEWLLFTRELRDHISQQNFVEYSKTCSPIGLKINVAGGRMDGADRAIIRLEVLGTTSSSTMAYEYGGWYKVPDAFLTANYGKTGSELIAADTSCKR